MTEAIAEFLSQVWLFKSLPREQLAALGKIAIAQNYHKNELIFSEGDRATGFFVVQTGKIKVFQLSADGKEQILQFFGVGEHFAEVPAFDGKCFPASAAAVEPSQVLLFPRHAFIELLEQQPTLAINILAIFARRLRQFASLIADLSLKEVPGRLAAYLIALSDRSGHADTVELDLTKAQLAAYLGTIPETLSRVLAKLGRENLIAVDGSQITLLDREGLKILATGK
ncbi:MAG: Crp/Fnr family transcriptional regulator [Oscillatoria sp. PMC 1051.18]|nr:Crp/Fnr family transcriptional regulator [Oscillatoria sp. PMC 1050.18]MEC5030989.1 Crp/Fnr family transcriptional regulator [Oscillatoria sp. PMC 1051.18]